MSSKKILVLISGSGSNLQAIIDQVHQTDEPGSIVAVISNRADAYGLERAAEAGISTAVVVSKGISDRAQYDQALSSEIDKYQPDLIVMAGFMRILTPAFVARYAGKMLNIHPSLLPKYQGLNTHQRAIDAQDEAHGASVHFVTEELDGGPVILQANVPIFSDDQVADLAARVLDQEHRIYPLAVKWFINQRLVMQDGKAVLDGAILPEQGYAND